MLGFIIYQFGFSLAAFPKSYPGEIATLIIATVLHDQQPDLSGVLMEFGGGIMAILGLIIAIGGVATSQKTQTEQVQEPSEPSTMEPLWFLQRLKCRFCGAEIQEDEIFCNACGKSQK